MTYLEKRVFYTDHCPSNLKSVVPQKKEGIERPLLRFDIFTEVIEFEHHNQSKLYVLWRENVYKK